MISNTKDIWRLESKWSDHDRFWTDHDRKLAEVSYGFFSISLAPTNIVVSGHTKNYGKTRKTKGIYGKTRKLLRRREVGVSTLCMPIIRSRDNREGQIPYIFFNMR